ncbi:MAG: hypothetical protein PVG32_19145, partial [Anaerolineales bacterium]
MSQNRKGQNDFRSALPFSHLSGARVARLRCPTLRSGDMILSSVLSSRTGHLYFAENRTFLLCIDRIFGWLSRAIAFGRFALTKRGKGGVVVGLYPTTTPPITTSLGIA